MNVHKRKTKEKVYKTCCANCKQIISFSFEKPADGKQHCPQCAIFIIKITEKYGAQRFDYVMREFSIGGARQGMCSYYARIKFTDSNYYEENKGIPICDALLVPDTN